MNNSNLGLILGTLNISYPFSSLNANTEVNKLDEYTKIIDLYIENIKTTGQLLLCNRCFQLMIVH